jgi:hypothetical protein
VKTRTLRHLLLISKMGMRAELVIFSYLSFITRHLIVYSAAPSVFTRNRIFTKILSCLVDLESRAA